MNDDPKTYISCPDHRFMEDRLQEAAISEMGRRSADVHAHCSACSACSNNLIKAHEMFLATGVASPITQPPKALREDILKRIAAEPKLSSVAQKKGRRWNVTVPRILMPTLTLACVLLTVQVVGDQNRIDKLNKNIGRYRAQNTLIVNKGASVSSLNLKGGLDSAKAQVAVDGEQGVISLRKVPAPPAGMVWQVWWVDGEDRIHSAGTIDKAQDSVFLRLGGGEDLEEANDAGEVAPERVFITAETGTGSSAPLGDKVANTSL